MKQLLFLLLFPCLALAQYTGNAGQKITLGEQTSADGLVYRGLAADTTRKPSVDTMAYILLDTNTNIIWQYKKAVNNAWRKINLTQSDTTSFNYVNTYGTQTVNGAKTLTSNLILKNSQEPSRDTIVTTQGFAADTTNWTRGTGWTFNGTQAVATAATGDLTYTPSLTVTSGNAYEITYTLSNYTGGTFSVILGNGTAIALPTYNVTGYAVLTLPTNITGGFRFTTSLFTGNLDNVSVVEISNPAPILFAGQDDGSATLYSSLRMPNSTTFAFGGGASYTTGTNNVSIGSSALTNNTTGNGNMAIGVFSLRFNTSGINNTSVGTNSLRFNASGNDNVAIGVNALFSNTTGNTNIAIGTSALLSNTTSINNVAISTSALRSNTTGNTNIAIGTSALRSNTTGNTNIAIGTEALTNNTTGGSNTAIGTSALRSNTTGGSNVAIGGSLVLLRTGNNNVANGLEALRNVTTGSGNTGIGRSALYNTLNTNDSLTGSNNIGIGNNAGRNISGAASNNIAIGTQVELPTSTGSNQGVYQNALFITGASGTGTTIAGNVGIAVNTPTARLHLVAGTATASTAPLKFTSGVNLTSPLGGEMEFNGTNLFFSPSTTRHTVNHGLTGSATLNFPSTTTLLSADLTITVTGAADGDVVSLGVPNDAVNANTCYSAWVSAANTVTVRFNNYSSGTVDPASALFKVFVTK